ncbi:hypothetical protein HID58_011050 [Brassica napus]|uniref:Uncharacterized protein n=1 Tax=Brassica napus TaxID=3708 RepID=A0ABQ8DXH7_BRANA|nr:hypothetical protein HID58_011050 [Brassica napus]
MIINPPKIPPHFTISLIASSASSPPLLVTFHSHLFPQLSHQCLHQRPDPMLSLLSGASRYRSGFLVSKNGGLFWWWFGVWKSIDEERTRTHFIRLAEEDEEEEEEGWLGLESGKEEVTSLPSLSWRHNAHIPPRFFV